MAKSRHNHLLDTIGDLILNAKKEGLVHLYTEGDQFDGRHIQVKGQQLFHYRLSRARAGPTVEGRCYRCYSALRYSISPV